jgi:hypothetical protein
MPTTDHNRCADTLHLNSKVLVPKGMHKQAVGDDFYVAYLPDKHGWPIIINGPVSQLLESCASRTLRFSDLLIDFACS